MPRILTVYVLNTINAIDFVALFDLVISLNYV